VIHFNIILPATLNYSEFSLLFRFSDQIFVHFSYLPCGSLQLMLICYMYKCIYIAGPSGRAV
jgi:hypothetical protein